MQYLPMTTKYYKLNLVIDGSEIISTYMLEEILNAFFVPKNYKAKHARTAHMALVFYILHSPENILHSRHIYVHCKAKFCN